MFRFCRKACRVIKNKLRHNLVQSLVFVAAFITFVVLIIESTMEADITLFRQEKTFATNEKGIALANVPLSKLTETKAKHYAATPILVDEIDKACSIGTRIRPLLSEIQFSNDLWQVTTVKLQKSYLNGAYIDTREDVPYVRILFLSEKSIKISSNTIATMYCRFWININNETRSTLVPAAKLQYLWYKEWGVWGLWHPYMLTCAIPSLPKVAETYWESVSLIWGKCSKATNDLRLTYDVPANGRKSFGVCVKGLSYPKWDISRELVEWIEMLKLLGVEGIHFNIFEVHSNVQTVMKYYEDQGFVAIKPVTLAGNDHSGVNSDEYLKNNLGQAWKQELITYNDCFLSNIYNYKFIAVMDIDEIILPLSSGNWNDLIQDLYDGEAPSWEHSPSFCFQMRLFVNTIDDQRQPLGTRKISVQDVRGMADGKRPFMMTRFHWIKPSVYEEVGYQSYKCIHSVKSALVIHNHSPRLCLQTSNDKILKECATFVQPVFGYTHHHRKSCCEVANYKDDADPKSVFHTDKSILRYGKELQKNTEKVMGLIFQNSNFINDFKNPNENLV